MYAAKRRSCGPGTALASTKQFYIKLFVYNTVVLTDRFNLQVHKEARQERIYNLELASDGFKFKPVDPPEIHGQVNAAMGNDGGHVIAKKGTLQDLANTISVLLRRAVTDRTGLQGYYDFNISWSSPETDEPIAPGFGTQAEALLMAALREKFGLRLTPGTGPVEYVVVDHVEPPSQN